MDDGKGHFVFVDTPENREMLEAAKEHSQTIIDTPEGELHEQADFGTDLPEHCFRVGMQLEIRGSKFRIQSINAKGKMVLKLLKRS